MNDSKPSRLSVLFVCTGNICRSPTAHFVFKKLVNEAGLSDRVHVDSAGTHGYHIGHGADQRSRRHAANRGYDLTPHRARRVSKEDFVRFDHILFMDDDNRLALEDVAPTSGRTRMAYLLEFAGIEGGREVPDPYVGGPEGFEHVLDLVEEACRRVLANFEERLGVRD